MGKVGGKRRTEEKVADERRVEKWRLGWEGKAAVVEVMEVEGLNCRGQERVSVVIETKQ